MTAEQIEEMIRKSFPDARVEIGGGEGKFEATVVDDSFADCTAVQRHRMVYGCVRARIEDGSLHALSIRAQTPDEAAAGSD